MLILEAVRRSRHSRRLAIILLLLVAAVRFGLGIIIREQFARTEVPWLHFLVGTYGLKGVSYVPLPWIAFPLLGFLFGSIIAQHMDSPTQRRRYAIPMCWIAILPAMLAIALHLHGSRFFRWGTMTGSYLVASVAVILLCYGASTLLSDNEYISRKISLRGFRSLAIVPIHYMFILLSRGFGDLSVSNYFILSTIITVASFYASSKLERIAKSVQQGRANQILWTLIAISYAGCVILSIDSESLAVSAFQHTLQIALCVLLICPLPFDKSTVPERSNSKLSGLSRESA